MKTQNISAILPIVLAALAAAPLARAGSKILIDFGRTDSYRGVSITSPDGNGKHWNSLKPGVFYSNLTATTGAATTIDFGFDPSGQPVATDSFNGPAGVTSDPVTATEIAAVAINAAALGDLGIKEAAIDYVSSTGGRFQIQGLDPLRRYKITFYGSSKFTTDATTFYRVYDDSGFSNQLATANLNIRNTASAWLHNQDKTAVLTDLVPSLSGVLYVEFGGTGGNSGRLNCMSIEDAPVEITNSSVLIDFGNNDSFRGVTSPSPDGNGNYWNSVRAGLYWADLVNMAGVATTIDFGFSTAVASDSFNGPAGATTNPVTPAEIAATAIDASVLGVLGVKEAAIDFVSGTNAAFEIAGLNPAGKYNLHFYGAKKYPDDANTVYSVYDDNTLTNLVGETKLRVGKTGFADHNQSAVAVIRDLTPSAGGALYVKFSGETIHSGFLNALAVEVADTTPPVITVTGDNPATVTWGDTYTDASATANDNIDGSVSVSSSGSVDTSLLGSYQINYSATDAAGNNATAIRTVNVVLPANPTVPGSDGLSALEKYAFGATGPNAAVQVPTSATVGNDLLLTAIIRTNDPNLSVLAKTSINLVNWSDLAANPAGIAAGDQSGIPANTQRREFTLPGGDPKRFLRLSITSP